jgi:hypothetical protein
MEEPMGWFFYWDRRPPRPGRLSKPVLAGEVVILALKYTLDLPAPGASDVATRELNITVDDQNRVESLAGDARTYELLVERDKAVALFLVDIDASGNRSQSGSKGSVSD